MFLILLLAQAAVEFVFVSFVLAVQSRRRLFASALSATGYAVHAVAIVSVVRDYHNLIPLVIGAFVGTWLAVKPGAATERGASKVETHRRSRLGCRESECSDAEPGSKRRL